METGEALRRILAVHEARDLIRRCAWCKRVSIDGEWHPVPRAALVALDSSRRSRAICPRCAAAQRASWQ